MVQAFYDWFLYYKVPRGDGVLEIVGGAYQNASFITNEVVSQSHGYWRDLVAGRVDTNDIKYNQTSRKRFESYVPSGIATREFELPRKSRILSAEPKPAEYEEWYFLDEDYELVEQSD
jgi:inorganic pyrophosphatase